MGNVLVNFGGEIETNNRKIVDKLVKALKEGVPSLYKIFVGFPVLKIGKYSDKIVVDIAIMTNRSLYICNIEKEESEVKSKQDSLYTAIETMMKKNPAAMVGRELICKIDTITYLAGADRKLKYSDVYNVAISESEIVEIINRIDNEKKMLEDDSIRKILSAMQGAYGTLKRERRKFTPNTKSEKIAKLDDYIETYDDSQFDAIISGVKGIQRIRGMAGCGKTIVLARKAAQMHIDHPDWNIVVTYSTRTQKQQLERLVNEYYERLADGEDYNPEKLRIMHTWGSSKAKGLYYEICKNNSITPLNYSQAKVEFGKNNTYDLLCKSVLEGDDELKREYDCIIVDEAQDFKSFFYRLCLKCLKEPRLVYAYDELQNLGGETMETPKKLFGRVINYDTPLRVCYRNHKNIIVSAHALGMGIYKESGVPVQMPNTLSVWDTIGYREKGVLKYGEDVTLYRSEDTSRNILDVDDDMLTFKAFDKNIDQYLYLAKQIKTNFEDDKLLNKDIMIIDLDSRNAEKNFAYWSHTDEATNNYHYAGKLSPEDFFREDSIVYSTVFRAKGNEAFMVYILNAHSVIGSIVDIVQRNALFTAITRSKGWAHVVGYGDNMLKLMKEYDKVVENNFQLVFDPYPTKEQLKQIRTYSQDVKEKVVNDAKDIIQKLLETGKVNPSIVAQDLFGVGTREELLALLYGEDSEEV